MLRPNHQLHDGALRGPLGQAITHEHGQSDPLLVGAWVERAGRAIVGRG